MRTSQKLLLLLRSAGSAALTYLLRDDFTTDASAPLASPRTCEPGPGQLNFVDTGNKLSIASGVITSSSGTSSYADPLISSQSTYARSAGRAFLSKVNISAACDCLPGWRSVRTAGSANIKKSIYFVTTNALSIWDGAQIATPFTFSFSTDYPVANVLRGTGEFMFVKINNNWTLLWIDISDTTTPYLASIDRAVNASTVQHDYFRIRDLSAPFTTDNGIASQAVSSPANAQSYTATADQIVDLTLTAAGTILTSGGLRFRVQDASNYWIMYFNTSGDFRVDSVAAGTPTNRVNVAAVITTSATRTIRAVMSGNSLAFYTLNGSTWTKRGSTLTNSAFASSTAVQPDFGADWTAANLNSFPVTSSNYSQLDLV